MHNRAEEDLLAEAKATVSQCDRCGACLPVCPLFSVRDSEAASARGKNAIARALTEGGIEPTRDVLDRVDFCLLCRACVEACPNKVRTDEAMVRLRQYFRDRGGYKSAKYEALSRFLKSPAAVKLAARAFALCRRWGLNDLFPYGMVPEERTRTEFLNLHAGPAALGRKAPPSDLKIIGIAKVAYFRGCGMRMLFPEASARTSEILAATAGIVPVANVCCGLPHLAHGMKREFLALARENIRRYESSPVIVSDCASCSSTLKHIGSYFENDPLWKDRAASFSRKVIDLTEYLTGVGYKPRRRAQATLTYHDPCHLLRGQGIKEEPRELLRAAGDFVEMPEADRCCGGAGSFHTDYPVISSRILKNKRENIEKTGATAVVTCCPGCLIQLIKAAKESGNKFQALHISQVICL